MLSKKQQIIGLIICLVISFVVAAAGAVASIQAAEFYANMLQPQWSPPGWVFGPVWTVLYGMMALAAWLVWRLDGFIAARVALSLYLLQLVFNVLWSWLFFAWHLGALAFIDIVLLWVSILFTILSFRHHSKLAMYLLVPYLLWVSFAAVLNFSMWQLNPTILG